MPAADSEVYSQPALTADDDTEVAVASATPAAAEVIEEETNDYDATGRLRLLVSCLLCICRARMSLCVDPYVHILLAVYYSGRRG